MKPKSATISIKTLSFSLLLLFLIFLFYRLHLLEESKRLLGKTFYLIYSKAASENCSYLPLNSPEAKDILKSKKFENGVALEKESIYFLDGDKLVKIGLSERGIAYLQRDIMYINIVFDLILIWVALYFYYRIFIAITRVDNTLNVTVKGEKLPDIASMVDVEGIGGIIEKYNKVYNMLLNTEKKINRKTQLEILGIMNSKILHDLKNSLSSLKILLYTAKESKDRKRANEIIKMIDGKISEMVMNLTEILKTLKHGGQLEIKKLDIEGLKDGFEREFKSVAETNGIVFSVWMDDALRGKTVTGNPYQIKNAIENLIVNAMEVLTKKEGERILEVVFSNGKSDVNISIRDNGTGIPLEIRDKIFDSFEGEREEGSGLGLSIVKEYIESNGGTVLFESSDRGTEFKITLPLTSGEVK